MADLRRAYRLVRPLGDGMLVPPPDAVLRKLCQTAVLAVFRLRGEPPQLNAPVQERVGSVATDA
jgi:hypothetical protein